MKGTSQTFLQQKVFIVDVCAEPQSDHERVNENSVDKGQAVISSAPPSIERISRAGKRFRYEFASGTNFGEDFLLKLGRYRESGCFTSFPGCM